MAVDLPVAVVIDSVVADFIAPKAEEASRAIRVIAVNQTIPVVVDAVVADFIRLVARWIVGAV